MLLYLDQGEELYTRAAPQEARRFSEAAGRRARRSPAARLCAACAPTTSTGCRRMKPLFKCHEHVNVPPLDRAQLHRGRDRPGPRPRRRTSRMMKSPTASPGLPRPSRARLPLLSYLLTDMWAAMVRRGDATLAAAGAGNRHRRRAGKPRRGVPQSQSRRGESAAPPAHAQARHGPARGRARPPPDDARGMHGGGMVARRSPGRTSLAARRDGRARSRQA